MASYFIEISDGTRTIRVPHGEGASMPEGGYGGWGGVVIPQREAITEYNGTELEEFAVPVLLHHSLMPVAEIAQAWAQLDAWGLDKGTLQFSVTGDLIIRPASWRWVIGDIAWSKEDIETNDAAQLIVVPAVITFLKYNPDQVMGEFASAAERYRQKKAATKNTYRVLKTDKSLRVIAKRLKVDYKKFKELNKRKHDKDIKPGQVLKLPPKKK